jgi:hypothetical protein
MSNIGSMVSNHGAVVGGGYASGGDVYQRAAQTESAIRQTEVEGEFRRLEKSLEVLGMVAEELGARLAPVRRQTGQAIGKGDPTPPEPILCQMADVIRSRTKSVERITAGLQTALGELEI